MCVIEFLRQNLAGLMTHSVIVLAGGRIFTAFLMTVQKNGRGRYDLELGDTLRKI
jgi:hypothetical protein